jgi:NAD(P)-dependent dehydrogenase (short-subunit alcohol dehydrogenase family)
MPRNYARRNIEGRLRGARHPDPPGSFKDILGALDYLLSEPASYVSGTNLLVTGAWNLG